MRKQIKAKIKSNIRKVTRNGKTTTRRVITPEYVKPKRRTKAQMEAIRAFSSPDQVQNPASGIKPQKPTRRLACQYLHTGYTSHGSNTSDVLIVEEEDLQYLREAANAIIFVAHSSGTTIIRVTSEKHSTDHLLTKDSEFDIVNKLLKLLRDDSFESAVVVTNNQYVVDIINGNAAQDIDNEKKRLKAGWTPAHEKANNAASRQKVSAELRLPKTPRQERVLGLDWKDKHLSQIQGLKKNFVVYESTKADGNFIRNFVNKQN